MNFPLSLTAISTHVALTFSTLFDTFPSLSRLSTVSTAYTSHHTLLRTIFKPDMILCVSTQ